ncbi:antigen WC1.1-like [Arapaima gigas]
MTQSTKYIHSKIDHSVPGVSIVLLGCLVSILVLLVARLVYKNWTLKKELAKSDHIHPVIYEEIDYMAARQTKQATDDVLDAPPSSSKKEGQTEGDRLLDRTETKSNSEDYDDTSTVLQDPEKQSDTLEYHHDAAAQENFDYDDVAEEQGPDSQLGHNHKDPVGHKTILTSLSQDEGFLTLTALTMMMYKMHFCKTERQGIVAKVSK